MSNITGIVHPKMKILSSFTLPQVVPNLYTFLSSVEHKGRYFEECGKLNSSRTLFYTMRVNGASKQLGYKLQNIFLCVQ